MMVGDDDDDSDDSDPSPHDLHLAPILGHWAHGGYYPLFFLSSASGSSGGHLSCDH